MRSLLPLLFFCSSVSLCSAQVIRSFDDYGAYIDKFEKEINESLSDSVRAHYCFKLSIMYKHVNDTAKARSYLNQGIALSEGNAFLKAASYYYRACALSFEKSQTIEHYLLTGDSLLKQFDSKESYKMRGSIWLYYNVLQQYNDNESEAINIALNKAIPYAEKSGDYYLLGNLYQAVAISLMNTDQPKKAQSYLLEASNFFEKSEDTPGRLSSLVKNYIISAENYLALEKFDSTKKELDKAAPILLSRPTTNIHIDYYLVEGLYFDKTKQYLQALKSFDKGISFPKAHPMYLGQLKYGKYKTLYTLKNYPEALVLIKDLLKNHNRFDDDKKNYYKGLFATYAELGNIQEAYKWSKRYIEFSDSLYQADYQNYVAEQEAKFNNAENQKKIEALQAENERTALTSKNNRLLTALLGTTSFFLLIIAVFGRIYYRKNQRLSEQREVNYQQKLKEAEQQQQIQFTKALMLGEEKERKRMAGDLHDGLGGMLAGVKINLSRLADNTHEVNINDSFQKVIDQLDESVSELRRIARNMMPESLVMLGLELAIRDLCEAFTNPYSKVEFLAFDISTGLAKEKQVIIYRIVQELLTNAVRHAQAQQILVQCSQNMDNFFITVEDNGIGFDEKSLGDKKGIGLANVKSRVEYLHGKMDIKSSPGEGTTINIEFDVSD
jgi:two-component system, NarL family, sensor kinase